MSKYEPLWNHVKNIGKSEVILTFDDIYKVCGFNIDHSFLTYKKELNNYGYEVVKISMKNKTVIIKKSD